MATLREHELAFQQDPAQMEPFLALRKAYRESGRFDRLVTLYETRAQALSDGPKASELFYWAAEVRLDQLADTPGAEADLVHALDRDAGNAKAAQRLKLIYREQGRTADYLTMLEMEAAAVAKGKDPARIADLQTEMTQLFANHFTRLERTLAGPQKTGEVTPDMLKTVESARKIYRALADWPNVVRLYELEIGATTDGKRRADLLLSMGKVLAERAGDAERAVRALNEVVRLRPRDEKALELLAGLFAGPGQPEGERERASQIYVQLARRRAEGGDVDGAIGLLRKALGATPAHGEASEVIEKLLYGEKRLPDLDRYYRERIAAATTAEERMDFLFKRAQLAERDLHDPAEALRVYEEIVAIEPPGGPASQHLATLYTGHQNYGKLAELRERQLEGIEDPAARLPMLKELATLYRDRLGDPEQAAVYLHAILQIAPADEEALSAYAEHFRNRGDFPSLLDLLEFGVEHARGTGAPTAALLPRLEEIAGIAERNVGDVERALLAWQRIEEIDPSYERAREAQKRLLQKTKQWDRMAALVAREAEASTDPAQRLDAQKRLARLYLEKVGDTARAVDVYRAILAADPQDGVAFRALVEIFEREEQWAPLADAIRGHLERVGRQERVSLLRRLVNLYEERIGNLGDAAWAASELLALVPGERETYLRLEAILERSGDKPALARTLEGHLQYATADERPALLRRLGTLLQGDLADPARASVHWEELARLAPTDAAARTALEAAYESLGRFEDLARVLELGIEHGSDDPAERAAGLRRLARLCAGPLADPARAEHAWERLLVLAPSDGEALVALSERYAAEGNLRALADMLERREALTSDLAEATTLALERARLLERRLDDRPGAIAVLERVIGELDPRNAGAYLELRRLAEAQGDWERVVRVAERQMFLHEDPSARVAGAMEIGALLRDRVGHRDRAIAAFERVLELAPDHEPALASLAPLYREAHRAEPLIAVDEKLLARAADPAERRRLAWEIADTYEHALGEPQRAFEWSRRLHAEQPDDDTLARLERLAADHGLWEELVRVYEGARARAASAGEQIALALKIAELVETQIHDPRRSFAVLCDALTSDPGGRTLLPELERLAERTGDWNGLLDVYGRVARGRPTTEERIELLERRASVREQRLHDPSGAMDEVMRSFALAPDQEGTQLQVLRLAELTGRWEDALAMQAQLFARAKDIDAKVAIARDAAALVEDKVRDRVRAFRAYLNAFRLAPEDEDIVGNLWRLAKSIGRYTSAGTAMGARPGGKPESTIELDLATLSKMQAAAQRPASPPGRPERTIELDLATLTKMQAAAQPPERTIELDLATLTKMQSAAQSAAAAPDAKPELKDVEELDELDELEEVEPTTPAPAVVARPLSASPSGSVRVGPPTPRPVATTPPPPPPRGQTFETPWEEFAHAYALLPANDNATRHRHLMKIAEIWEVGARDVVRAFDALERAFRLDPSDQSVRNDLTRLAEQHGEWDRVCAIYLGAIDRNTSRELAVNLHHDVARFREALGQRDKAEERYRSVLQLAPDDRLALHQIEDILRTNARWEELASLLEKRTRGLVELLPPGTERQKKVLELADIYERRLDRPWEAIDTYERYVAQVDEDERSADDATLIGEQRVALDALARLYARVERWPKVVETLARAAELAAANPSEQRALRRRLAEVQERELVNPVQAIATYEAILADAPDDPEALAALERLLEREARWESLEEVLERRAERATGAERTSLVRRRARILEERLGNPDAAATALRGLGAEVLADGEVADALVRNLRRAGLVHEAAKVLVQRIEALGRSRAPAAEAALYLQLARLRSEELKDHTGARTAAEAAIARTPNDAAALGVLAAIALAAGDFAAYADAKARQGEALGTTDEAAACFVEAGRVRRDQLADPAAAREAFERALEASTDHPEALRALASLLADEGQRDEARALLQRRLETADEPAVRAVVLTDLARTMWEKPGDVNVVLPYLEEALDLDPDHLPAVVTMMDVLEREQQWAEADRRIAPLLRRAGGDARTLASLHERLADALERLGRHDDGYRHLLEADRLAPGRLSLRLALAGNRFEARKWREVVQHLDGVESHAEAAAQPDAVARALHQAGQAEQRLRNADKAAARFQAALALVPTHTASLRSLADLAIERGELRDAATFLRRVAETSTMPAERIDAWGRLGDLLCELGDEGEARTAFEAAVAEVGDHPAEAHLPLFEKTFALQKAAGATAQAAQTAARLVALERDPKVRADRRREAAVALIGEGDLGRARELLHLALDDDPADEEAIARLVEVSDALARPPTSESVTATGLSTLANLEEEEEALAMALARSLAELPAPAAKAEARARRAALWRRFAQLEAKRRGFPAAVRAYEEAIAVDPGDVAARRALADLYGDKPEHAAAALANHRAIVTADATSAVSVRALARAHIAGGRLDWARCCFEILDVLGLADDEDRAFLAAHPIAFLRPDDPYPAALEDAGRARFLAHPEAHAMGEVFATIWDGIPDLAGPTLESLGVSPQDKVSPMADEDVVKMYGQIGKALGNQRTQLFLNWDPGFAAVGIAITRPPSIVVPGKLNEVPHAEARFEIGRAIELSRPELILAATVRPREFTQLFGSLLKAFHPRHARRRAGAADAAGEQATKLKKQLPYKVAKRLGELFQAMGSTPFSSARWRQVVQETGNRAGLVVCGDLGAAARVVAAEELGESPAEVSAEALRELARKPGAVRELLRFALSEEYFALRGALGTATAAKAA